MRIRNLLLCLFVAILSVSMSFAAGAPRVITITADKDNLFKIPGQKMPAITLKANEVVILRIIAHKSTEVAEDGAIHTLTINALKDQGWDIRLKEGTHDYTLVAPSQPGEYVVECTVKCGPGHDDMKMRLVVTQ